MFNFLSKFKWLSLKVGADSDTPGTGVVFFYAKSDGLYYRDEAGVIVKLGTLADINDAITDLVGTAGAALDTLGELADALNDDASYAATITTALAAKAPLASPALTGNPTTPTQAPGDNSTKIASTAYVDAAVAAGGGGGGGGTMPGAGYAHYLAVSLEPDAIEAIQKDTFSYAVGSGVTKLLMASWSTRLGASGRMGQRNPQRFMPLCDVTLNGLASGAVAVIIDPAATSYTDAWATYYDRMQTLAESKTRNVPITTTSQKLPFLPGPYGAIITHISIFDLAWIVLRTAGYGINLWDEISDSASQRVGDTLTYPVSKVNGGYIESSSFASGASYMGSVSFVLLPSTWSNIPDPVSATYLFRDDFMGTALDTGTTWNRAQSTAGNVEIDTTYQWCKMFGNASWGTNGLRSQASNARAIGLAFVADIYAPIGSSGSGFGMIGFSDGSSHSYTAMAHAVNFAGGGGIVNIYENGTNRGTVGSGWTEGGIYRVRITLAAAGAAVYEIQGGKEYPPIGGASWTTLTPGSSSSASTPLYAAGVAYDNQAYVSDFRVFN